MEVDVQTVMTTQDISPSILDSDISQPSSPSPRLQTPPNGENICLVTYDLARLAATACPRGNFLIAKAVAKQ
ncbi:hypothetical protein K493DRAFT_313482 [Basidiobolus meristosporus CBS 931.73]|uniref:Uncharacterized protein n=1 Tax=Basidiobolus meristosporus CBS 931.73 TaxID=1314790 RepID=A0A1Y1YM74_9FUNG|nr:hypothetical protein K493DRAFT_313482 [Basidiobolus meristosporus CBS 931.73]|eukprot:ORX98856.1 hypothetical protein K493DRAFT_313482 [Basidiobolus meristosporus CBS 931.73]